MSIPKEAITAIKHVHLIGPLLPRGKLAVVIHGSPPTRSSHILAHNLLVETAAKHGAHRHEGVATVRVHFGPLRDAHLRPSLREGHSRDVVVDISNGEREVRRTRMFILCIVGCLVYRGAFVIGKRV